MYIYIYICVCYVCFVYGLTCSFIIYLLLEGEREREREGECVCERERERERLGQRERQRAALAVGAPEGAAQQKTFVASGSLGNWGGVVWFWAWGERRLGSLGEREGDRVDSTEDVAKVESTRDASGLHWRLEDLALTAMEDP